MTFQCKLCDKKYQWEHDLKRHVKTKHSDVVKSNKRQQQYYIHQQENLTQQQQQEYTQQQHHGLIQQQQHGTIQQQQQQQEYTQQQQQQHGPIQQQQQQEYTQQQQQGNVQQHFTMLHPFTCIVSGPTSSGKTFFVTQLLRTLQNNIHPCPERIIWLYKRWQPLYDFIQRTVLPKVEFIKGIPMHLEKDSFLNPKIKNLIVLDDMATESAKDPRVTDLFTEGSHHRNLSVIALTQNLYFNKDPTQRRNCHYMVLFNNPVDKHSIMTLARQMYPRNPKELIQSFEEATAQPYGSLLIDLKPTTPDHLRMRPNILGINKSTHQDQDQKQHSLAAEKTYIDTGSNVVSNTSASEESPPKTHFHQSKMTSCDDCGVLFENNHDLQNHVKKWCPEKKLTKRHNSVEENESNKRMRFNDSNSDENIDTMVNPDRENAVYRDLIEKVKIQSEDMWQQKLDKYIKEGLSDEEAKQKADKKLRGEYIDNFISRYAMLISYIIKLRNGYLHNKIMDSIELAIERGVSEDRSIRMILRKYTHYFEEYIENEDEDSISEDSVYTDEDSDEPDSEEGESDQDSTVI